MRLRPRSYTWGYSGDNAQAGIHLSKERSTFISAETRNALKISADVEKRLLAAANSEEPSKSARTVE